ncbi:hypothetical protein M514_08177 [Trichuris suis]|uniref:Uncharacterized protein n=1 Tax=Trichuris suis TaxID=68888 RepID=A0A085NR27_9BILA|nr:hypothetical protein M514_08177 [Trichuris suis]
MEHRTISTMPKSSEVLRYLFHCFVDKHRSVGNSEKQAGLLRQKLIRTYRNHSLKKKVCWKGLLRSQHHWTNVLLTY